jgi:molecular chaperone GrpE
MTEKKNETPTETPPAEDLANEAPRAETPALEAVPGDASAETAVVEGIAADVAAVAAELAETRDRLLRALAETENVRRRAERDRRDTAKYAIANFAREVLSVSDNLRRALAHIDAEARAKDANLESLAVGVEMVERELLNSFERFGIKPIEAMGKRFDHNLHEAMFEVDDPAQPTGTVVHELERGYLLEDRLLRPAKVGLTKGGPAAPKPEAAEAEEPKAEPGKANPYEQQTAGKGGTFDEKL